MVSHYISISEVEYQKEYCISVSNLSHCYSAVKAIDQISFNVNYGTIFGFLGPNGAGKTTTIKVLTTLSILPPVA